MGARPIVQIRRANQRDAAAIELLIREAFREHELAYTREAFDIATPGKHEIEKRIEDWAVWIAINAKVIVGTVSAHAEGPGLQISRRKGRHTSIGCRLFQLVGIRWLCQAINQATLQVLGHCGLQCNRPHAPRS
jgi:hypothetical protein